MHDHRIPCLEAATGKTVPLEIALDVAANSGEPINVKISGTYPDGNGLYTIAALEELATKTDTRYREMVHRKNEQQEAHLVPIPLAGRTRQRNWLNVSVRPAQPFTVRAVVQRTRSSPLM